MHIVYSALMVGIPGWLMVAALQAQNSGNQNLDSLREIGSFVASILIAGALNYIRNRSIEVRKAKAELPSAQEVHDIKDENIVIRADLQLLTESLERVRGERDDAIHERDQAIEDRKKCEKLLADTTKLLEEERGSNANLARINTSLQEQFDALNAEFQILKASNSAVDRFAVSLIQTVEEKLGNITQSQGAYREIPPVSSNPSGD